MGGESIEVFCANNKARNQKVELKQNCPEGRKNCSLPNGQKATGQIVTCCITFYYLLLPGQAMAVSWNLATNVLINEAIPGGSLPGEVSRQEFKKVFDYTFFFSPT